MKTGKIIICFSVLMWINVTASNQDSERMGQAEQLPLRVKAVLVDSDGVKWFGTSRGLYRYDGHTWRYYTETDGLPAQVVNALALDETGQYPCIWVATMQGISLMKPEGDELIDSLTLTVSQGLLDDAVTDIAMDSYGGKYFSSASGVTLYRGDSMDYLIYSMFPLSMVDAPADRLEIFMDTIYIASEGGIGRFVSGVDGVTGATRWTSEYGMSPASGNIKSVMVDSRGNQWFGTDMGLEEHRGSFAKENWFIYTTSEGLVNNTVISMAEDEEGGKWFGTLGGVSYLQNGNWTSYTAVDGLNSDTIHDIAVDPDGSVWFATERGICRLSGGVFTVLTTGMERDAVNLADFVANFNRSDRSIFLSYYSGGNGAVSVRLYDLRGALLARWMELPDTPGEHRVSVPLHQYCPVNIPQGIYILQLINGGRSGSKKVVITP